MKPIHLVITSLVLAFTPPKGECLPVLNPSSEISGCSKGSYSNECNSKQQQQDPESHLDNPQSSYSTLLDILKLILKYTNRKNQLPSTTSGRDDGSQSRPIYVIRGGSIGKGTDKQTLLKYLSQNGGTLKGREYIIHLHSDQSLWVLIPDDVNVDEADGKSFEGSDIQGSEGSDTIVTTRTPMDPSLNQVLQKRNVVGKTKPSAPASTLSDTTTAIPKLNQNTFTTDMSVTADLTTHIPRSDREESSGKSDEFTMPTPEAHEHTSLANALNAEDAVATAIVANNNNDSVLEFSTPSSDEDAVTLPLVPTETVSRKLGESDHRIFTSPAPVNTKNSGTEESKMPEGHPTTGSEANKILTTLATTSPTPDKLDDGIAVQMTNQEEDLEQEFTSSETSTGIDHDSAEIVTQSQISESDFKVTSATTESGMTSPVDPTMADSDMPKHLQETELTTSLVTISDETRTTTTTTTKPLILDHRSTITVATTPSDEMVSHAMETSSATPKVTGNPAEHGVPPTQWRIMVQKAVSFLTGIKPAGLDEDLGFPGKHVTESPSCPMDNKPIQEASTESSPIGKQQPEFPEGPDGIPFNPYYSTALWLRVMDPACDDPPYYYGAECLGYSTGVLRYTFIKESGICVPFLWGGCESNENNFPTYNSCVSVCGPQAVRYIRVLAIYNSAPVFAY